MTTLAELGHSHRTLTIYVVDTSALATIRAVRDEFIDLQRPPISSLSAWPACSTPTC